MNRLDKMHTTRANRLKAGTLIIHTNPVDKWEASDKKSRVLAISAMCAKCVGCDTNYIEPGFRVNIKDCELTECPLHLFRPYK